jgi:hypothetical protein
MQIFKNLITTEQIANFRQFWVDKKDRVYVNFEVDDGVIDHRLEIKGSDLEFTIIEDIVRAIHPNATDIWSALQQQNRAHNIHIDDYSMQTPHPTWTYVIALDTIPEFKTIVFQEKAGSNALMVDKYFMTWNPEIAARVSNISETEDLEHTQDPHNGKYIADYLTLDGIFTYEAGSAALFETVQLHCTSNWNKYSQHKMRELLQIHYTVPPTE